MNPIGIRQAVRNLPQLIRHTLDNCEETIIVSDKGAVVMIDQDEWEKMKETLRLFCDKKSLNALLEGHRIRESGNTPDSVSIEEAFRDL
jgi:PHD/YefM family antitoxin component YafN of YafNO toxin-antitoxin module